MIPQFTLWVQKVTFVRSCNCSLYMYHGCWRSLEQSQGFLLINFIRVNSLRGRCKREEGRRRKVCKGKGETSFLLSSISQHAKKVVSDSPGLVDFATGLVFFVLNLPNGQVLFFGEIQITEGLLSILPVKKGFGAS